MSIDHPDADAGKQSSKTPAELVRLDDADYIEVEKCHYCSVRNYLAMCSENRCSGMFCAEHRLHAVHGKSEDSTED